MLRQIPNLTRDINLNEFDIISPLSEYEDHVLNEICPNPDNMTYEQLLELQEKVGHVESGFTRKEIEVWI